MTACNVENVTLLADALEQGKIKDGRRNVGFNLTRWRDHDALDYRGHKCGTVACIGGAANLLFGGEWGSSSAAAALGLDYSEGAQSLFFPNVVIGFVYDWSRVPLAAAVEVLRHLADKGRIDWPRAIKLHPLIDEKADA